MEEDHQHSAWTKEHLNQLLKEMLQQIEDQSNHLVVYRHCLPRGLVNSSEICGHSECKSCIMLAEAIDRQLKKDLGMDKQE